MERFTEYHENIPVLKDKKMFPEAVAKLAHYEDLEEQGLLLKLPCKCDEVVWVADKIFKPYKAVYASLSAMLDDIEHGMGIGYTKEEAEKALAEMGCE